MRFSKRLLAIPVAVVLLAASGYVGFLIGRDHKSHKRAPVAHVLRDPQRASCAQIGFGVKRFPAASPRYNVQAADALAAGYLDTGSEPRLVKSAFALTLLAICDKTRDPAYRPEGQARSLGDRARDLSVQTQTDFAQTLITLAGTEARGKEQLTADTSFVRDATTICDQAAAQIKPLLRKVSDPTGAFKTPDADRLRPMLDDLTSRLKQLADGSGAANARSFVSDFTRRVDGIGRRATRLAKLNDHWKKNAQRAALVSNGISQKQLEFGQSSSLVHDCGTVFEPG